MGFSKEEQGGKKMARYRHGGKRWKIKGNLHKTGKILRLTGVGKRMVYIDESGKKWMAAFGKWWKYPEETEID